tara:strand:+ start:310 stop:501 length:192 start_codon:yes stop_codon:yes gene_type:complete
LRGGGTRAASPCATAAATAFICFTIRANISVHTASAAAARTARRSTNSTALSTAAAAASDGSR